MIRNHPFYSIVTALVGGKAEGMSDKSEDRPVVYDHRSFYRIHSRGIEFATYETFCIL